MKFKKYGFSKACRIAFCIAIGLTCYCVSLGQVVSPAPKVDPIVDPLTEMGPSESGEKTEGKNSILDLDIEQLGKVDVEVPAFDIEVTSVSKQESTIGKSPAAVFVITNEMIQRSGATCIPEVLRLAPGVEVARLNSHTWAISIRGFNDRYNNKLLVLVDGRSVYSPLLSGTFWDMIDMPLEDIERIEVIRGPGGTLWGANAVNGVINIISKKAKDTQGTLIDIGGGSQAYNISTVRYGGQAGMNIKYRVWGKYVNCGPEYSPTDYDSWQTGRGGFYADWNPRGSKNDLINFQGNFYGGNQGVNFLLLPYVPHMPVDVMANRVVGENSFLTRWTHTIDDESDWSLQAYYDHMVRNDPQVMYTSNTFDVEFQYRCPVGRRHSVITGVEFRQTQDFTGSSYVTMRWDPSARLYSMISAFVQDEIELVDDKFFLTVGSKFESNSFTGFEYQPSIRGLWTLDNRHVLWGAISRAVRTPNRFDENGTSRGLWATTPLTFGGVVGNPDSKSEDVVAYELGYRAQTNDRFSWDVALFYNRYENLMASTLDRVIIKPTYIYPYYSIKNCGNGYTYGFELTANWEATKNWRLGGSYSFLVASAKYFDPTGQRIVPVVGNSLYDPRNQVRLQSYWNFAPNWQLDLFLRYVDQLPDGTAPAYITMDARLGWQVRKNLEFSVVGQNLFAPHHLEFAPNFKYGEPTVEINRAVFAKITWTR